MSAAPEVVVAGGGIAAAATAIRLCGLGFGVRLLLRRGPAPPGIEALPEQALGLLDILGEPGLVAAAGGVSVTGAETGPRLHVERRALARVFLERARARGAVVDEVSRLPPADVVAPGASAVVDATGRAAAWSRPLLVEGRAVAWQFEGPPQPDLALRVVRDEGWWAYRLGTPATIWAGVVVADGEQPVPDAALARLGLDAAKMAARGRRAARVQRAVHPVAGRRIAVGDAALAHDPIAGAGIRFALASAVAAATALCTWIDDPGDAGLAARYYDELVDGEHGRHLEARRAILTGHSDTTSTEPTAPVATTTVPDVLRFSAPVAQTSLAVDGMVRPGPAVRLPDGTLTRWLGSFDLLVLARMAAEPIPRVVLLALLQQEGLDDTTARAVVSWCTRHHLLTG